jgi:hypothetical protein
MYVFTIIDKLVKLVEVYKTVVRSILIYANETKVNMTFTKKKRTTEMRKMQGVTLRDRNTNETKRRK